MVRWTKAPSNALQGNPRDSDEIFTYETIDYDFTIIRVNGSFKWKHNGAEGCRSVLKLKRWDEGLQTAVDILQLGEFVGASDDFATLHFDFEYSSSSSLCGLGKKGGVLSYVVHVANLYGFIFFEYKINCFRCGTAGFVVVTLCADQCEFR